jgi:hypothetical protein
MWQYFSSRTDFVGIWSFNTNDGQPTNYKLINTLKPSGNNMYHLQISAKILTVL